MKRVCRELLGDLRRFLLVECLLRLLDEAQDVTEVEDAAGHPVGVERLEVAQVLAGGREDDRAARHAGDRQRGAASGIAVEFGEHDAGEVDAILERLRRGHGVLTDHRVDDEQHLVRVDRLPDVGGLLHHFLIDAEAAGRVDDDHVMQLVVREFDGVLRHLHRVTDTVARFRSEHRNARLLTDDLQLGDRVRSLQVGRDQDRGVVLFHQPLRQLAGERRLARTLQAGEHDHGRRVLREFEATLLAAEDVHEFLVDDLHNLLGGVERPIDLVTEGSLPHRRGEVLDDRQGDVGVEQGTPDFADGAVDIRCAELALAAEVLERVGKTVGEVPKCGHGLASLTRPSTR